MTKMKMPASGISSIHSAALFLFAMLAPILSAQSLETPTSEQPQSLRTFLQSYLGKPYPAFEKEGPTQFSSAFVDLKGDGKKQVIVYISGRGWCGSGGCVMLILAPQDASYKVVAKTTITRLPIRVLKTRSNGWNDVSVVVGGGGILPYHRTTLEFDGTTYPTNPSLLPSTNGGPGTTVISDKSKSEPVYPNP